MSLNLSRNGDLTMALERLFQHLTSLLVRKFLLIPNWTLPGTIWGYFLLSRGFQMFILHGVWTKIIVLVHCVVLDYDMTVLLVVKLTLSRCSVLQSPSYFMSHLVEAFSWSLPEKTGIDKAIGKMSWALRLWRLVLPSVRERYPELWLCWIPLELCNQPLWCGDSLPKCSKNWPPDLIFCSGVTPPEYNRKAGLKLKFGNCPAGWALLGFCNTAALCPTWCCWQS